MSKSRAAERDHGIEQQVVPHATRAAARLECELVSVRFVASGRSWILRLVIDKNGGVLVDDCARVSRQLSAILDVEDFIPHAYTLEVSSPGLDDSLLVAADYRRFVGRHVRIQANSADGDDSTLVRGLLRGLREGVVLVEDGAGDTVKVAFDRVVDARLEVEI